MNSRVRELEDRIRVGGSPASRVDLLNDLAWELRHLDTRRALSLCLESNGLASSSSYRKGLAYSLRNEAYCRSLMADNRDALQICVQAMQIFEEIGDEFGQASVWNVIGNIHHSLGDSAESLKAHHRSLGIKEAIGDQPGAAYSWNNLGTVYDRLDDNARALECYFKSLKIKEEIGDVEGQAGTLNNIGFAYEKLGDLANALEYYDRCSAYSEENGDGQTRATALMNSANVYVKMGNLQEGLKRHEDSLRIKRLIGDREGEATSLVNLGEAFLQHRNHAKASECFLACMKICRETGLRYLETETLNDLGTLALEQSEFERAEELFDRALTLADEIGSKSCLARSHEALCRIFEERGDAVRALKHYKDFHNTKAAIFNEDADRKARGLIIDYEIQASQKEKEIYRLRNIELAQANEEKSRLLEQLRQQAVILERHAREDPLTGLYNRRFLDDLLAQEFSRARRFQHPLTVVLSDIDHFKSVNDRFSHHVGDEVLRVVADIFRKTCRAIDIVARYGGEEFVTVLPETSAARALILCEKIRCAVQDHPWNSIHADLRVTISMGISDDVSVADSEKMISAADAKLYEAKNAGRNRVCR